ncbi:GntR family transcriptional regulator [Sphingobacterium hungaricum]|uniref:GntR family transcriptional regulator n=1 Tax=Sphingobacterium hungaricum TaxID=2082723 RepID=A0A928UTT6_9SPHI|nr:GntR family transcriptional regulator [Sphingobacterium hungaricum]MBE8713221.1 GntR family transcriptional regulator [Sphingobacterium hungaricum]
MQFHSDKAIYIQIADYALEKIGKGEWKPDDKIPSVRDLASELEVNPNTVMRTYDFLQQQEIIYNKRGLGFFVQENAKNIIHTQKKKQFMEVELPAFFESMDLLGISIDDVVQHYKNKK